MGGKRSLELQAHEYLLKQAHCRENLASCREASLHNKESQGASPSLEVIHSLVHLFTNPKDPGWNSAVKGDSLIHSRGTPSRSLG